MSNNTDQNLNLLDKLVLLAIDDEKGHFVSNSMVFGYCMAGAVLYELSISERIDIRENKVKILNRERLNDPALQFGFEFLLKAKKERSVKHWITTLGNKSGALRQKVLDKLLDLKILEKKENKILWVFTQKKYPTLNEIPEGRIKRRLTDIVTYTAKPEVDEIMMISLVDSCGLNKEVYGKAIAKERRKDIKRITKEYQFADTTGDLIKEIHDTIVATIVVMMAATTVITSN